MDVDICCEILYSECNKPIELSQFPSCMKMADVTSVYKEDSRSLKDDYNLVNILHSLSKLFEKCSYKQVSLYFDNILQKYGFRKNLSIACLHYWKNGRVM